AVELGAAESDRLALAPALFLAAHVQGFAPRYAREAHGVDLTVERLLALPADAHRIGYARARRDLAHRDVVGVVGIDRRRIAEPRWRLFHCDAVALELRLVDVLDEVGARRLAVLERMAGGDKVEVRKVPAARLIDQKGACRVGAGPAFADIGVDRGPDDA